MKSSSVPHWVVLDVDYREGAPQRAHAVIAAVYFKSWQDSASAHDVISRHPEVADYEPGAFFKRELPCLLTALAQAPVPLAGVVIDGYVWLGENIAGLGERLWRALGASVPVIGVAKTAFVGTESVRHEVVRGQSHKPLYVTAAGCDAKTAADSIASMHGDFRIPTLIKRADSLCRAEK
ncbi:MAG: endonuclease V [Deltaproteobacteria bacterium]|nr:endonuclease V [Deltaproteobacteria bacterium]